MNNGTRKALAELPKTFAHGQRYNSAAVMSGYWNHVAAQNEQQSNFCDFIGDRQRVVNPTTGQTGKLQAGYKYNYQSPSGQVIQTNSPYAPPADFTPLLTR